MPGLSSTGVVIKELHTPQGYCGLLEARSALDIEGAIEKRCHVVQIDQVHPEQAAIGGAALVAPGSPKVKRSEMTQRTSGRH